MAIVTENDKQKAREAGLVTFRTLSRGWFRCNQTGARLKQGEIESYRRRLFPPNITAEVQARLAERKLEKVRAECLELSEKERLPLVRIRNQDYPWCICPRCGVFRNLALNQKLASCERCGEKFVTSP